ncbi:MAG TPA: hypothetical protein VHV83_15940 [Armatimonadota bacterium]|nr:hypothetical protein [Armatimonadota bacterium]
MGTTVGRSWWYLPGLGVYDDADAGLLRHCRFHTIKISEKATAIQTWNNAAVENYLVTNSCIALNMSWLQMHYICTT